MATNICSHASLKLDPTRWDAELKNRRSQAVMIPGTEIAECKLCDSSLTLIVDQAAYDAWDAETAQWDSPTIVRFDSTPSCKREPVEQRDGYEPAVQL